MYQAGKKASLEQTPKLQKVLDLLHHKTNTINAMLKEAGSRLE